ncbi:MAG: hypothetical protein HOM77_04290, partial [Planctomycetes bacterium]|nr:hypothetical protein [Planctomycetota bacterium]
MRGVSLFGFTVIFGLLMALSCSNEMESCDYSGPTRGLSLAGAEFASDVEG